MSALRPAPILLLAATLAACSDHTATAPAAPAAPPAPRAGIGSTNNVYAIYPMTRVLYKPAVAIASALPKDGRACNVRDGGHAYYTLTLTERLLTALRLRQDAGYVVTIRRNTEILYAMGGTKQVIETSMLEMPGRVIHNQSPEPLEHWDTSQSMFAAVPHGGVLSDEDLRALRPGDMITARGYATATASVGEACGKTVLGAMAAWHLRQGPAVYVRSQTESGS